MLDIEYIKQIDEVLEVEGFKLVPPYQNKVVQMSNYTMYVPSDDLWILGEEFSENKFIYPLYLQRVIEAINKAYMYDDVVNYYIVQDLESVDVYRNTTIKESFFSTDERFNCYNDEDKEKAIIWVMDHIKEKV